jgi:hypothetical protein
VIYGHDGGVRYDGSYAPTPGRPGFLDIRVRLNVPPNVGLVQGIPPQPTDYWFDIACTVAIRRESLQSVATPFGPVTVRFKYLRDVPASAA